MSRRISTFDAKESMWKFVILELVGGNCGGGSVAAKRGAVGSWRA